MADRTNNSTIAATLDQDTKLVTTAGTPVPLVGVESLVEAVEIEAKKSRSTTNAGAVYVGFTPGAGTQLKQLVPGEVWVIAAPVGKKIDLSGIYIDAATSGDGVLFHILN